MQLKLIWRRATATVPAPENPRRCRRGGKREGLGDEDRCEGGKSEEEPQGDYSLRPRLHVV